MALHQGFVPDTQQSDRNRYYPLHLQTLNLTPVIRSQLRLDPVPDPMLLEQSGTAVVSIAYKTSVCKVELATGSKNKFEVNSDIIEHNTHLSRRILAQYCSIRKLELKRARFFQVTYFQLGLVLGSEIIWLEFNELLRFFQLYSSLVYTKLSQALPSLLKSLGLGCDLSPGSIRIELIYFELIFMPGPLNRVGYQFQLYRIPKGQLTSLLE